MEKVNRNILSLAVPSILANLTVPLVGLADMAVSGHLNAAGGVQAASFIGGIAIGTMLFDLMYWNFGFLRVGTGGLAAQAYGRGDAGESSKILSRAVSIALACAAALIALQWLFLEAAFFFVDCSPEVEALARQYFKVRIWAAPATLSLMAFKGWFIGMQDGVSPMITDIVVNVVNVAVTVCLALGLHIGGFGWEGLGFRGIAWGTIAAQYSGLLTALLLLRMKYRRKVPNALSLKEMLGTFAKGSGSAGFLAMNRELFIRSFCMICVYVGFTSMAAAHGDLVLATASILMKIMMLFSYFTDGFAYAGEALTGRCIGAGDSGGLKKVVRAVFQWSAALSVVFMAAYAVGTVPFVGFLAEDEAVVKASAEYVPWLVFMPLLGCAAFAWDGIYVGATQAKPMRNAMILSAVLFFTVYFAALHLAPAAQPASVCVHALLAGYMAHLAARVIWLTAAYKRRIHI